MESYLDFMDSNDLSKYYNEIRGAEDINNVSYNGIYDSFYSETINTKKDSHSHLIKNKENKSCKRKVTRTDILNFLKENNFALNDIVYMNYEDIRIPKIDNYDKEFISNDLIINTHLSLSYYINIANYKYLDILMEIKDIKLLYCTEDKCIYNLIKNMKIFYSLGYREIFIQLPKGYTNIEDYCNKYLSIIEKYLTDIEEFLNSLYLEIYDFISFTECNYKEAMIFANNILES